MIQHILIQSRKQIEELIKNLQKPTKTPWALISIWNNLELIHVFTRGVIKQIGCQDNLSIRFADLTLEEYEKVKEQKKELKLFDKIDAKKIIDFIEKINQKDIPTLIIHCAAGISRSSAVGLFACKYFKLNEDEYRKNHPHILPNFYVLSVLNEVSKINEDYVKFWDTQENLKKRELMFRHSFLKERQ